jgi:hypothetical protein
VTDDLLADWERRLRINVDAHNLAERRFHWLDNVMGAFALATIVVLGTVGSAVNLTSGWRSGVVITVTCLGALCSAFQTQLRLGVTAVAHQVAAREYGKLRRGVEQLRRLPDNNRAERIDELREAWDAVASAAPNVPERLRREAKERFNASSSARRTPSS